MSTQSLSLLPSPSLPLPDVRLLPLSRLPAAMSVRVVAPKVLNLNVTAALINSLVDTISALSSTQGPGAASVQRRQEDEAIVLALGSKTLGDTGDEEA